nr:DUF6273 domain-containing protein [uncultured Agathobaculum sp.]
MAKSITSLAVGDILKIRENGVLTDFVVAHIGKPLSFVYNEKRIYYDASCDGVWILRTKELPNPVSYGSFDYTKSNMPSYMEKYYEDSFDEQTKALMLEVKIPTYYDRTVTQFDSICFLLSEAEVSKHLLDYFGLEELPFTTDNWCFCRSARRWTNITDGIYHVELDRYLGKETTHDRISQQRYVQPVFILTKGAMVSDGNELLTFNILSVTAPDIIMQGQHIPLSWSIAETATAYVLERKADTEEAWTQVYSGAETSYEDTAGEWTTVQYRVKAGDGTDFGDYTVSGTVQVLSTSALAISGEDADLGTLTADLRYTVLSDTGKSIALSCVVNGQAIASVAVENGFTGTIPVLDLPSGAGKIVLQASVDSDSGLVTATRTWTYRKPAVAFPVAGGVAQLTQDGSNVFPPTLAECVRVPAVFGGDLGKALEMLLPLLGMAAMAVGSYEGTGTFGEESPNSLTFAFAPQMVIVSGGGQSLTLSGDCIEGNAVTWHSDSAESQMNQPGVTYTYAAIGKAGA